MAVVDKSEERLDTETSLDNILKRLREMDLLLKEFTHKDPGFR
jgi:hypothetical protein